VTSAHSRIEGEVVRKALHLLIAFAPTLASASLPFTILLLASGTLFYVIAEHSRLNGRPVLVVSDLTLIASRQRDRGRFVLGPVTLGLGAMVSLMLYPEPAATLAIYALAFGDGFASLVGRLLPGRMLPLLRGKSLTGSAACFVAVLLASWPVVSSAAVMHGPLAVLAIACTATALEAMPTGDFDNLIVPIGTGLVANLLLP
jgi:dolichol kinase